MSLQKRPEMGSAIVRSDQLPTGETATTDKDAHNKEHFRTDHLLSNLKGRTISSGAITISAQGAKFILSLVSTMVLARLLTPQDFGLVAMVTTVTGFLRVFKDAGLTIATVQRETITHAQVSNLFWINLGVSALSCLLIASAAPILAWFYEDSRLISITLVLSTTYLISGSAMQHQALLRRQMRFKAIAVIELTSMMTSVSVGVGMALLGYRYWALVGAALSLETMALVLTWSISRWRPQLPKRRSGTRPLVSFGMHRMTGDFLSAVARGTDNILIGRVYGADAVGLYSRASHLLIQPLQQFLRPINAVFIPALSRLQNHPERYRSMFLRLYGAIALTAFFFSSLFLAVAAPLTLVVLGPKWEAATAIFGGFTIAALCVPLAHSAMWLMTSQGRGKDLLMAQSINSAATFISILIGLPYGPVGVAISYSLSNLLVRLPLFYYCVGRRGPVRTMDLWGQFFRHLPIWICVFCVAWLARHLSEGFDPVLQLLICGTAGVGAGLLFIASVRYERQVAFHLWETLRQFKKKSRN